MRMFTLEREQFIPVDINKAWEFFSRPDNLKVITPPYLNFKILEPADRQVIHSGMHIIYRVHPILGIPMKWITEIEKVNAPFSFIDTQKKGPYKVWRHKHIFIEVANGVMMRDEITYALPFGILGEFAHALFVERQLKGIFKYREQVTAQVFSQQL